MGCEIDQHRLACRVGQLLLNLRRMTMICHAVGLHILIDLTEQIRQLRTAPCAGGTGLGVDDDGIRVNQAFLQKRVNGQGAAGGITTRVGYQSRLLHSFPVDLAESVDCFRDKLGRRMLNLIPLLIGRHILDSEISA